MNNINATATGWMTMEQACQQAKEKAAQSKLPAFVYQTGPDRFNFRFVSHNAECGVLIARYDAAGKSY
jgi:hypothetical protein